MLFAKRHPHAPSAHPGAESETTVWVMVAILLGLLAYSIASLLEKVSF